jgi:cystathionine beta-lyase/cystathionine gamma-synthase
MTSRPANATTAIHAGELEPRIEGAICTPIFQSSTYEYHGEEYHRTRYMRLSTSPNHRVLASRLASLEGTEAALATGSGMAAISAALLSVLSAGDHILVQDCLYGGTTGLLTNELARLDITHTHIDPQDPSSWAALLRPNTRAIYVESLTNPLVQMADLEAVVAFAREHGLVSFIDNTFASPVNFRPAELGFDLVMESCTKFMNGHTDIIAGSVAGSEEMVARAKRTLDHLGGVLDTHTCFLLERGLKTLPLRMREHNENGMAVARFLEAHPAVEWVSYPGLESHPQHERARRLLRGFGGMVAFEMKGDVDAADAFLSRLEIPAVAVSLGGTESLIVRPAVAIHGDLPPEERARSGITDGLIRFSVGLEDSADLLADLEQALAG